MPSEATEARNDDKPTQVTTHTKNSMRYVVTLFCLSDGVNLEYLGSDERHLVTFSYNLVDLDTQKVVLEDTMFVKPPDLAQSDYKISQICTELSNLTKNDLEGAISFSEMIIRMDSAIKKQLGRETDGIVACTDGLLHLKQFFHPLAAKLSIVLPKYLYKFINLRNEYKMFSYSDSAVKLDGILEVFDIQTKTSTSNYCGGRCSDLSAALLHLDKNGHTFTRIHYINDKYLHSLNINFNFMSNPAVKIRGLLWESTEQDIAKFFAGLNIVNGSIMICITSSGRRNGEAYVVFETELDFDLAMCRHRHYILSRYIEISPITSNDAMNILTMRREILSMQDKIDKPNAVIKLRGVPFAATESDIVEFFEVSNRLHDKIKRVIIVNQANGRSSGEAFVYLNKEEDVDKMLDTKTRRMRNRYIDIFKSSFYEVCQVLSKTMPANCTWQPYMLHYHHFLPVQGDFIKKLSQKQIIHFSNLPASASCFDIINFLEDFSFYIDINGIHLIYDSAGFPLGEAIVELRNQIASTEIISRFNGKEIRIKNEIPVQVVIKICPDDFLMQYKDIYCCIQVLSPYQPYQSMESQNGMINFVNCPNYETPDSKVMVESSDRQNRHK